MKKIRIAGALLAPLLLVTACGGGPLPLSFSANWYYNTALGSAIENTYETLEYSVSFESTPRNGFSLSYTDGVYKTTLRNDMVEVESGSELGYVYSTEYSVSVQFSFNGEKSQTFTDTMRSEVKLLSVGNRLRPVRSHKEVHTHAPLSEAPTSLEGSYAEYQYAFDVEYNSDLPKELSAAKFTYTDLADDKNNETIEFDISGSDTFLDNEEILLALRGLDLARSASFRTINTVTRRMQTASFGVPTALNESVTFAAEGLEVPDAVEAYSVSIRLGGDHGGQPQTLVYAKTTDTGANLYRNVLLRMEEPALHSLGTKRYTLVKAVFTTK